MTAFQGIPPGCARKPPLHERAQPPPASAPIPLGTFIVVATATENSPC
ncbi:hypothetical protein [Afipia broomeae]|uniref:Uncharacterized protein n=1 Tax=Afipia broomeae ATCC 49717 TaxID=883078 RepID=K8P1A0_9BRAD|nr:hypothetical protein [Afipia broomeae]EKS34519.1 hypothetical protein HMPREF9695_04429 [Afipia broomeae ATCC 49717]